MLIQSFVSDKNFASVKVLGPTDRDIQYLLTDSRLLGTEQAPDPERTLFFALKTDKNDGANYIPDLIAKGVKAFVVTEKQLINLSLSTPAEGAPTAQRSYSPKDDLSAQRSFSPQGGLTFIVTDDTLVALQQLAAIRRSLFTGPVIGITGSNGKTVVKEWLYNLLKDDYTIIRSPKSFNSQIGVPLSVWQLPESFSPKDGLTAGGGLTGAAGISESPERPAQRSARPCLALFEAGISQPGEMERLERIIRPTIGVVTYIGAEHGENFESLEQKRAEKMKLFAHCDTVLEDPTHQNVRTCALVMRALGYDEETISRRILAQTHETVMEINLTHLVDNVRYFRSLLKPTTKLTCMVKAFAYGSGSVEVSKALQASGLVDYLAVAVADEGVELRKAGVTLPIIVMDPEVAALDLIVENNLEPNIYSFASLHAFLEMAKAKGLENYPVHIKIDSGMHRLGFYKEDLPELIKEITRLPVAGSQSPVKVASVFSHLAGSDEAQFDAFTREQIAYFRDCADILSANVISGLSGAAGLSAQRSCSPQGGLLRHILNSAGIERFTDSQFDMCRLGIGMYGFSFNGAQLKNVCTLKTTILSVKTVAAGETIGYGRHTTLTEDRRIAVIPIGYADGFDRRFGNHNGEVLIRGVRCPIVGNVCMDQAMVDVTEADAQVGDEAIIFGQGLPVEELANKLGTITYEILTSVSRRVKRVYIH
ncbi:MAG: alanine racemase [Paludibacteraceae bacterium]|nr:alanine racemase [Paludibacteraceae bacterium]